jgi:hypothetical protein
MTKLFRIIRTNRNGAINYKIVDECENIYGYNMDSLEKAKERMEEIKQDIAKGKIYYEEMVESQQVETTPQKEEITGDVNTQVL